MDQESSDLRPFHRDGRIQLTVRMHEGKLIDRDESALLICGTEFPVPIDLALDASCLE